jgi:class 3 adenylate cyclase/tetratricopeptide (TPR) repeat protein
MHELMDRVLRLMAEAVHRYEGTVNQFLGDGLMALFGAPVALEDHALRGAQAALAMQETVSGLSEDLRRERGLEIRLRIGLNTGLVVVGRIGDDLRMDYTAVGDTTHLTARIQALAEPGSILASETAHRLLEGYVRSEPLGPVQVKGVSEPVAVHRITGRRRHTRLEVSADRGLSPLVGRDRELRILRECLDRAREGRGQVVGIVGEPGVGKSRLVHELQRSLEGERLTWLTGHCLPYGQATPYLPTLEILRANFHVEEGDNPHQIEAKLRRGVAALDLPPETTLPFLRELFLPASDESLQRLDPKTKRRGTFEAIRALTVAGSQRAPLVVVLEDLQWIDQTSEDYAAFLIDSLAGTRALLVTTVRPGYAVRWADKPSYTQIALDTLDEGETRALLEALLGSRDLPRELPGLVHERAEGNPLFVEEIARSLLERGVLVTQEGSVRWAGAATVLFPESARGIIRARLDRLEEPVKRTAQAAAVIGRQFGVGLLSRVAEDPSALEQHLEALKRAGLVHETRFFPEVEYIFKHGVVQEIAYESLLQRHRSRLHGAAGRALEQLVADRPAEHYEPLARHFALAGDRAKALEYLLRAADKANRAFANREVIALGEQALGLLGEDERPARADLHRRLAAAQGHLGEFDASLSHAETALGLYEALGDRRHSLHMHMQITALYTGGYWDGTREDMALRHLEAAAALCEGDPDSIEKANIHAWTSHLYLHRGVVAKALEWGQRADDIRQRLALPIRFNTLATALAYSGRVDEGLAAGEGGAPDVIRLGRPLYSAVAGHELALTLALLRAPARALQWGERFLAEIHAAGREPSPIYEGMLRRPLTLAHTLRGDAAAAAEQCRAIAELDRRPLLGCVFEDAAAVGLHRLRRGEHEQVREPLERLLGEHGKRNNALAVAGCSYALGLLHLERGDPAAAEAHLAESLELCRSGGNVLFELWVLPALCEAQLKGGQPARAAEGLERGRALLAPGQTWYGLPAALHLAQGMVAAAGERWDEAARAFEQALDLARRHDLPWEQARALGERGLMHRARGGHGDRDLARGRLGEALELFRRIGAVRDAEGTERAIASLA